MKRFTILLIVAFGFLTSTVVGQYLSFEDGIKEANEQNTTPVRNFENGGAAFVKIGFEFTGAFVAKKDVTGEVYQYLHINGFPEMGQVGAPALPARNEIIAMPQNSNGKIIILSSEYYEYEGFNIHPALEPAVDTEGAPEPKFYKDDKIYSSDKFFPETIVEITDVLKSRATPLAVVQTRPVQFNPVTGKIRVYTNIKFKVVFEGGDNSFDNIALKNSLFYTNLLKRMVINSKSIPDGISIGNINSKVGEKNYIIITHSQFLTQANQLAVWKRQMGYTVEVVSRNSWTSAQVKDSIHTRYSSWNPKPDYFVIIGDHDGAFAVPGEIHQAPDGNDFATDLYYACMGGAGDWVPDMAHGRISVRTVEQAQIVVDKIINYEENPTTNNDFYENGLNCAQYQDDNNDGYADRRFCHTSENIRDYMKDEQGYSVDRIYYTSSTAPVATLKYNNGYFSTGQLLPAELRNPAFNWEGYDVDITNEINDGKFYVFHRDHGYAGGVGWAHPQYTVSQMGNLANGDMLPVIFSINCHTGEFQITDCFAEKFVRMENKGAVGVVAAAYYSYSGYNDALAIGMVDAIWADPGVFPVFGTGGTGNNYTIGAGNEIYRMGDVVNQGLVAMLQNWNGSAGSNKYEHELFHWFTDPALKIWTANPNINPISATHSSNIDCSGTSFSITGSSPDAVATLVYDGELLGEAVIDASGNATINYNITANGSVAVLTISKHNQKPYVATLDILGCGIPVADFEADDACPNNGQMVSFTDKSHNYPTSWSWSFNPNTVTFVAGTNSSSQNPRVTFNADGFYSVTLTATNANGSQSLTKTDYIRVSSVIDSYPYVQNFDSWTTSSPSMQCTNDGTVALQSSWINFVGEDIDWDVKSGATASSSTGPSSDHTSGSGNYLYTESSSCYNHVGTVITPVFDLSGLQDATLSFWYHMYGSSMGTMQLQITTDCGKSWENLWTLSGDQGNSWQEATVVLDDYVSYENAVFRFVGTTGSSYRSDMAFDDFTLEGTQITGTPGLWTGNSSVDWFTPSNWDDHNVPTSTVDVVIPDTAVNWPVIAGNLIVGTDCNSITMTSGYTEISVSGNLSVQGGKTFFVDPAGTARIKISGDFDVQGTFSPGTGAVEFICENASTISAASTLNFYNLTIGKNLAVTTANADITVQNDFTIAPKAQFTNNAGKTFTVSGSALFEADDSGTASFIDLGTATFSNQQSVECYLSQDQWHMVSAPINNALSDVFTGIYLTYFDESNYSWHYITSLNYDLTEGRGFMAWSASGSTGNATVLYNGNLNTGNISVTGLSYTASQPQADRGWNMVGNPYPSSVKWTDNWSRTDVDATIYVYDYGTSGNYLTYNTSGTGTLPNGNIAPGQGFWIKVSSVNASLTIPHSERLHSSQPFYKEDNMNEIHISVAGNGYSDKMIVQFNNDATEGFDSEYDAWKLKGDDQAPQLYSMFGDDGLTVNALPFDENKVIPIAFETGANTSYQLSFGDFEFNGNNVWLEDRKTGEILEVTSGMTYDFEATVNDDIHRFNLHFGNSLSCDEIINGNTSIYSFDSKIYISSENEITGTVSVYDLTGKVMFTKKVSGNNLYTIPVYLKTGLYIVKLFGEDDMVSQKVYIK